MYVTKEDTFEEAALMYDEHMVKLQGKFDILKDDLDWEIEKK